jgi:NAD-dependent dihydropyrimidine dehydrogenase PreA subunit
MRSLSVPRESIPWYPTVNVDACTGDRACIDFCKNAVFRWDEEGNYPVVEHPYNCVLGCSTCSEICPAEAITFPTLQALRETMRKLRAEMDSTLTSRREVAAQAHDRRA